MRSDIQCLRGIAIILVFIFHIFPKTFLNGFLGVDIFFVISGFLMAKTLSKPGCSVTLKDFLLFYYRRFRRILPMYFFVIFLVVILIHLVLPYVLWESNIRYAMASLFLMTNQLVIYDQADYFNQFQTDETSTNAFLHLWSLSVEMQFYLLVPFIFLALQKTGSKIIVLSIMTVIGYMCSTAMPESIAFNFMLLRLWQFSSGFLTFFCQFKSAKSRRYIKEIMSIVVVSICFLSHSIEQSVSRPLVTLATAVFISAEPEDTTSFQFKPLEYIGDISYVMYLVHWPIISIFMTTTLENHIFCIVVTIILSVLFHHLLEKKWLELAWQALITLLIVLIFCNAGLLYSVRTHDFWMSKFSAEVRGVVDRNLVLTDDLEGLLRSSNECMETKLEDPIDRLLGYCKYPKNYGNTSVMMIGNSYVLSLSDPIRSEFNANYSTYRYYSIVEGYGLYADSIESLAALKVFKKYVKLHKPDVLFIVAKYSPSIKRKIKPNDEYLQQISENIRFYEQFASKIYILGAYIQVRSNFLNLFMQSFIENPNDLEKLHLNRNEADAEMENVKKRFEMVNCEKSQFFDLSH